MLKTNPKTIFFLSLFVVTIGFSSCFIKKKTKKENTKEDSFTANLVTKYNILFNSHYLLQQAQKNIDESTVDNYQQILSIFKDPNTSSIQQNKVLMDSVIRKSDRIINEKQNSKYVDEAFLLKGKAYYHQGDYFNAQEFFQYVYDNAESNPKLQNEALLWQVRSLLKLDNLKEATIRMEEASVQPANSKALKSLLFATQATFSLNRGNKASAISQLYLAIEYSKSKKDRLRWQYLLGQLFFENGEDHLAQSYFSKVAKSNESYEMIFYTNLYLIEIANKKNPTIENRVKLLSKLLHDGKNKNYKGQIYQRIGDTYLVNNQSKEAIEQYELASKNTINNPYQQSLNYQRLADLYFNDEKYAKSSLYYDSTVMVLPKENPAYDQLSRKQTHLDSLVQQLTIIAYQDTLIQLATLSEEERELFVEKAIAENQPIKPISKKRKQNNSFIENTFNSGNQNNNNNTGFYFSSAAAVSQGHLDFKKRWGSRLMTGIWRYSNQSNAVASIQPETSILNAEIEDIENSSLALRKRYLDNLPDTPEKLVLIEDKIKAATIRLAEIYQNELNDDFAAIKTYEAYLTRFPSDKNTPIICFHLHRLHTNSSPQKASQYKDRLLKEFPSSLYSMVLSDPDYYKKQYDLLQRFNEDYTLAYDLFHHQKYAELILKSEQISKDKSYTALENNLAQLAYLRAIAIGRTSEIGPLKTALSEIVDLYPTDEIVVPLINQHLAYIDSNEAEFANRSFALDRHNLNRTSFEKDFALTPWPELSFTKQYVMPESRKEFTVDQAKTLFKTNQVVSKETASAPINIDIGKSIKIGHENSYRDLTLFPDNGVYLFVINVMHGSVNLSPSRYGIGQFNRSQYSNKAINHQLKTIANENQLIHIGVFSTFAEAKAYEAKIKPMLGNIMKITEDLYSSFIVTEPIFNTFTNFDQVEDYTTIYQTQQ